MITFSIDHAYLWNVWLTLEWSFDWPPHYI